VVEREGKNEDYLETPNKKRKKWRGHGQSTIWTEDEAIGGETSRAV
jgi:hypothetical protein